MQDVRCMARTKRLKPKWPLISYHNIWKDMHRQQTARQTDRHTYRQTRQTDNRQPDRQTQTSFPKPLRHNVMFLNLVRIWSVSEIHISQTLGVDPPKPGVDPPQTLGVDPTKPGVDPPNPGG